LEKPLYERWTLGLGNIGDERKFDAFFYSKRVRMKALEEKIRKEGRVLPGHILKVGNFLNQQVDVVFLKEMAKETARLFEGMKITKVLTVEASGIAFATAVAMQLDVPMVFAKKHASANVSGEQYFSPVYSYTHKTTYDIAVSKEYIKEDDCVLITDDFLANGNAIKGLIDIVKQAGAKVVGCCAEIEKGFQGGGDELRQKGYKMESLAIIESMSDKEITFR
jgi:xanthine phosphoribosyltransferase